MNLGAGYTVSPALFLQLLWKFEMFPNKENLDTTGPRECAPSWLSSGFLPHGTEHLPEGRWVPPATQEGGEPLLHPEAASSGHQVSQPPHWGQENPACKLAASLARAGGVHNKTKTPKFREGAGQGESSLTHPGWDRLG